MKIVLSALVLSLAAVCPQLKADFPYPDCVDGTLQSYINSSGCILGQSGDSAVVFSGFTFPAPLNPNSVPTLNPSEIELDPVANGLSGSFDFSGDFSVPAGDTLTYYIDYFLLLDPGPILGGGSLHLDPTGNVSVTESICTDSYFAVSNNMTVCQSNTPNGVVNSTPQSFSVDNSNPPLSLSTSYALNPAAYNSAAVQTTIVLTGGASGADSGGVVVTDTVGTVPEPMTSLLCLGGLIAIGVFRRRFMI